MIDFLNIDQQWAQTCLEMSPLYETVYQYADEGQLYFSFSADPVHLVYVLLKHLDGISRYHGFYCGETEVSPSNTGGKKSSALLTLLVLKLTVVTQGKKKI